jgi:hypothetical protein
MPYDAVRFFPHGTGGRKALREGASTWFPLSLLLEEMSRCSHMRCERPTVYVWGLGEDAYLAACGEHVCDLAHKYGDPDSCPNCHWRWRAQPAEDTIPRLEHAINYIRRQTVPHLRPAELEAPCPPTGRNCA